MGDRDIKRDIKVTDKRMFTPDGELRRDIETPQPAAAAKTPAEPAAEAPESSPGPVDFERPTPDAASAAPSSAAHDSAPPGAEAPGHGFESPGFVHLVSMLAEPVAIYLGDVQLPEGGPEPNLELARIHIDLLEVLQEKTRGNLSDEEDRYLEGLLYQLRMRYLQKKK